MADHIVRLSELKLIRDGAELEAEISTKAPGWFVHLYRRFRANAAEAIAAIAFVDAEKPEDVRALQNRIKVYDEFIGHIRAFINEGIVLDRTMTDGEREEILEVLLSTPEGQREAVELGLVETDPID